MKIFLGGVNGVGKTTVLAQLGLKLPRAKVVHGSKSYMRFLSIPPNDYDRLRAIPEHKHQVMLRKFLEETLASVAKDSTFIFDGHFVVFDQADTPIIKVADWIQSFDLMILLEASADDIYERISYDQKHNIRQRSYQLSQERSSVVQAIQQRLNYTRNIAQRISQWFQVPLVILENQEISVTVNRMLTYVKDENAHV